MKKVAKIKLPKLVFVPDYHDFDYSVKPILDMIVEKEVGKIKVDEIGFCDKRKYYVGLIYVGSKPAKKEVEKLLKEENVVFQEKF